jgi:hypothetical protein
MYEVNKTRTFSNKEREKFRQIFAIKWDCLSISQKVATAELQTMETQPEGFLPMPPNHHKLLGYLKTLLKGLESYYVHCLADTQLT